jgi:hypothetical protein
MSSDHPIPFGHVKAKSPYTDWGELAVKLEDDDFKAEYVFIRFDLLSTAPWLCFIRSVPAQSNVEASY